MTDWQPIETAPKDGTKVDLWVERTDPKQGWREPDYGWCVVGWAMDADPKYPLGNLHEAQPTHWMPLPDPPKD